MLMNIPAERFFAIPQDCAKWRDRLEYAHDDYVAGGAFPTYIFIRQDEIQKCSVLIAYPLPHLWIEVVSRIPFRAGVAHKEPVRLQFEHLVLHVLRNA